VLYLSFLFILFFNFSLSSASDQISEQLITTQSLSTFVKVDLFDAYKKVVQHELPEEILIQNLVYDIDGTYKVSDIACLLGLVAGVQVTKQEILNALFYVKLLGIFESIVLECTQLEPGVYNLTFKLKQATLIDYIKVQGFLRNKQRIKNLYMIDQGEIFDQQKHLYSLENMKNYFKNQGYLQAQVYDSVLSRTDPKKVVVSCDFALGHRFLINRVVTQVHYTGNLDSADQDHLKLQIADFLTLRLADRKYSASLLESAQRKLKVFLETQGFVDISFSCKHEFLKARPLVDLCIDVTLEKKREFVFWGNSYFRSDKILSHLLLYGKSAWYFPLSIITDEIETFYKDKGFKDVKVVIKEDKQRVFCSISEGARSAISSVSVVGAAQNNQAADMIHQAFKPCLKAYYYDKDLLKRCLDSFVKAYKSAGFWNIKVLKQELLPTKKANCYEFVITIDEGSIKKLGNYHFKTHPEVQAEFIKNWQSKQGFGFDHNLLSEQKLWLLKYCKSLGFQKVSITYELAENQDKKGFFDVIFTIDAAKKSLKFGQPVIIGNVNAPYIKLLLECDFKTGEPWDKKKLDQTLKNFKEIKVFENVQIYPGAEIDPLGYKPVFIKLANAERYDVKASFGLQQIGRNLQLKRGFTYKIGGKIGVNRLFSPVDRFCIYADVTRFYQNIGLTYDVPWMKSQKIRTQFKAFDEFYQRPVYVGSHSFLYKSTKQGFLCNMVHSRGDFSLSGTVGFELMGLYEQDQPDLNEIISYDKHLLAKKIGYVFCEPVGIWRVVDNELNPQRGHQSVVSCKAMFDCDHKTTFYKLTGEHTQYIPLAQWAVLAVRGRAGHVFNRKFDQLHPNERFYLGGASSIRGYMPDYCPPFGKLTRPIEDQHAGLPPCANDVWRYAPQGGRTMFNINAEMRLNLYKGLGLVMFSDWGALIQNSIREEMKNQSPRNFGGSGIGFRYDTPLGPFRFDVGLKWHIEKPDFESRQVLYLSIGQAF
jgi:outer membrane protein assembly factor BamA